MHICSTHEATTVVTVPIRVFNLIEFVVQAVFSICDWAWKTGLIYTKYTCLYYGKYLQFFVCYPKSVCFIEVLIDLCTYDDILDAMQITDKSYYT